MSQLNLFQTPRPSEERQPPNLDFVRKHLGKALRTAQFAERMPWPPTIARNWEERFAKLASDLPSEEANELVAAFEAEIARLKGAEG